MGVFEYVQENPMITAAAVVVVLIVIYIIYMYMYSDDEDKEDEQDTTEYLVSDRSLKNSNYPMDALSPIV